MRASTERHISAYVSEEYKQYIDQYCEDVECAIQDVIVLGTAMLMGLPLDNPPCKDITWAQRGQEQYINRSVWLSARKEREAKKQIDQKRKEKKRGYAPAEQTS